MIKLHNYLFIFFVFLLGLLFYSFYPNYNYESFQSRTNFESELGSLSNCPNLLVKTDDKYYLHNTNKAEIPGVNPIKFNNLDEYVEFMNWLRSRGIRCPILYLQKTYDTQGQSTFRMLPDPEEPDVGLPTESTEPVEYVAEESNLFGNHDTGSMPGFDPHNQYIGYVTPLDKMFNANPYGLSDNPMDTNWGGPEYSTRSVLANRGSGQDIMKKHIITPNRKG